jgi:hypothetical protein
MTCDKKYTAICYWTVSGCMCCMDYNREKVCVCAYWYHWNITIE